MKQLIAILLALLIGFAGIAIVIKSHNDNENNAQLREKSERMTQLIARRDILEDEIDLKWEEYNENTSEGMSYISLFLDNIHANILSDAYPVITGKYGYVATAVMSNLQTPGDDGCITIDDYNMLVGEGWDFAIGTGDIDISVPDSVEVLAEYIDNYKTKLEEKGLPMPVTFCFDPSEYSEKYDDMLWEKGFKVVRHFGETGEKFSRSAAEGRLYHLASGRICTGPSTMKADIGEAVSYNYTYSATVRYIKQETQDDNLDCTHSKYTQMLDYIVGTPVVTASELYNKKIQALSQSRDYIDTFNIEMVDMEERLEIINAEIESIVE